MGNRNCFVLDWRILRARTRLCRLERR